MSQIKQLIKDLSHLIEDVNEVIVESGDEIIKELEKTHVQGKDPHGNPWKKRKNSIANTKAVLNKTDKLKDSYKAFESKKAKSIQITNEAEYAHFHNEGTKNLPVRQMLPDKLPDKWAEIIEEKIDELIEKKY